MKLLFTREWLRRKIESDPDGMICEAGVPPWYCDQCHVEVYDRRCQHCGKTKREKS